MILSIIGHLTVGWIAWSLSHYLLHRVWHKSILDNKYDVSSHGESEHHRCYDNIINSATLDPHKIFISFPYLFILPQVALISSWYGFIFGLSAGASFFASAFISMTLDDQAHRIWHSSKKLGPIMSYFKNLHNLHHTTHKNNFSFITGIIWDLLFRSKLTQINSNPTINKSNANNLKYQEDNKDHLNKFI